MKLRESEKGRKERNAYIQNRDVTSDINPKMQKKTNQEDITAERKRSRRREWGLTKSGIIECDMCGGNIGWFGKDRKG